MALRNRPFPWVLEPRQCVFSWHAGCPTSARQVQWIAHRPNCPQSVGSTPDPAPMIGGFPRLEVALKRQSVCKRPLAAGLLRCSQRLQISRAPLRRVSHATHVISALLVRRVSLGQPCTLAVPDADPFSLLFAETLCVPLSLAGPYMRECDRPLAVHFRFGPIELKFRNAQRIWSCVICGRIGASCISRNCSPYFFDSLGRRGRCRLPSDSQKQNRQ
jgi:hypothetical protein